MAAYALAFRLNKTLPELLNDVGTLESLLEHFAALRIMDSSDGQ